MPFRRQSDNTYVWITPTSDEIARRVDELINPRMDTEVDVPMTGELQGQLVSALNTLLPKESNFQTSKETLYNAVINVASKER